MSSYIAGLDLGQANDPSALVIIERREDLGHDPAMVRSITETVQGPTWRNWGQPIPVSETRVTRRVPLQPDGSYTDVPEAEHLGYDVRHAMRFKLGTPYPQIVKDVGALLHQPPLRDNVTLVIDATGVGRPVCDLFSIERDRRYTTVNVVITAGTAARQDEQTGYWHVPKCDLVGVTQVALQNKRLRFPDPKKLPAVDILTHELQNFRVTISAAGTDSYAAWRERDHDDLVLSLALALWQAERGVEVRLRWL